MRFVSGAESVIGQNLVACQVNNQIYFYTVKAIMPDQELLGKQNLCFNLEIIISNSSIYTSLVWYCKEFAERLNYSVNGELMEKKIRMFILINKEYNNKNNKINYLLPYFSFFSLKLKIDEQLLSDNEVDSSSNIKCDSDDVDMAMSNCAPCPSSLVKESLKRNITARLSLNNHQNNSLDNNNGSSKSALENLSLAFTSSLQKSTKADDSTSNNLLSNVNSHNNNKNSNGKLINL